MTLPWVRLETSYPDNPKVLDLVTARRWRAITVHTFGLSWSGRAGTDGYIPAPALPLIHADKTTAAQLVDAGLWTTAPGGWVINGWADYQESTTENQARRETAQTRGMKGNCARWHGPDCWRPRLGCSLDTRLRPDA